MWSNGCGDSVDYESGHPGVSFDLGDVEIDPAEAVADIVVVFDGSRGVGVSSGL